MILAADYPFMDILWTMVIFFCWVAWIWILVIVLSDVFGRDDLSGWGKAGWTVFMLVLPFLGVLIYLIAHGSELGERRMGRAEAAYGRHAAPAGGDGAAGQIADAKRLLDSGAISQAEFEQLKAKALA
jgi:Short C-terminal domain/Phospholipase_D-nuclease N-terminal